MAGSETTRWWVAPTFADEAKNRAAGLLHLATMFIGASSVLGIVVNTATGIATRSGTTIGIGAIAACSVMNVVMRRGHVREASIAFVALCFALTCALAAHYGGRHPSAVGLLVLVALLAGTLLSDRAAVVTCACALLANGLLIQLEGAGLLPSRGTLTPTSKALSMSLVLLATTAIFVAALRRLRTAAAIAEARRRELAAANAELRAIRESLEVTVAERTRSLVEARDDALAATRAKSTFLANMSHELRTPLHAVIGIASLLNERNADDDERRLIETLRQGGDALLAVINDVLDFSRIEARGVQIERAPYAPREVVEVCAGLLGPLAHAQGLALTTRVAEDVPALVLGDGARVRQVLLNLLGNALKFTSTGAIDVDVAWEPAQHLRFTVRDTGAGVAPELRASLFLPFVQGDLSTTKRHGGAGLGLSISKHLVDLMGGAIGVDDAADGGASFWFTIRAAPAQGTAAAPSSLPLRSGEGAGG